MCVSSSSSSFRRLRSSAPVLARAVLKKDFVVVLADGNVVTYASGVLIPRLYKLCGPPHTGFEEILDHVRLGVEGEPRDDR